MIKKIKSSLKVFAVFSFLFLGFSFAYAGTLTNFSYSATDNTPGITTDYTISFTTETLLHASGDMILRLLGPGGITIPDSPGFSVDVTVDGTPKIPGEVWGGNFGYIRMAEDILSGSNISIILHGILNTNTPGIYGWAGTLFTADSGANAVDTPASVSPLIIGTPVVTYSLLYSAGAGGSISGNTGQSVDSGLDGTAVTAVPDSNHEFLNWSDDSTDNPRTDVNVLGSINVTANFELLPVTFSGAGTLEDPYIITSCDQLQEINLRLDSYFKIEGASNTIDCSDTSTWNDNGDGGYYGFQPIGDLNALFFGGHLDGNNNTITNLYINRPLSSFVGLFSVVDSGATISDLTLQNVNITGNDRTGALVGSLSGTVTNVHASGTVTGTNTTGGLVGSHVNNNSWYNSSPLVYTWNGNKYKYVADVGNLLPKEVSNAPDLASIDSADLIPKDGKYSMKISEEYNEIVYYDKLALNTYDHAPGYSFAVPLNRNAVASDIKTVSDTPTNPLLSCTDTYGNNCEDTLKANDDKWAVQDKSFVNSYILDFGDLSNKDSIQLVMRGARDYDLAAKMRAAGNYQSIRTVQVKNANGNWVEIYNKNDLGSDGTPRLRTIDLTGKFLSNDYHVKVGFDTMYMNYFAVDTSAQVPVTVHTYSPTKAELGFRGFTKINHDPYIDHDYNIVTKNPEGIFKPQFGNFTKYGDVSPLLENSNNQFVIMKGGDHMDIEFPYVSPAEGMVRSFVLDNDAWYKHASNEGIDLLGKTVNPLPYQGMTSYTANTNGYPMTDENSSYLNTWNTRAYSGVPKHDVINGSTIINSSSSVAVTGTYYTGGLVGYNEKEIRNSFASGDVNGNGNGEIGGLVGFNGTAGSLGWIHDSYATGNVTGGNDVGGLVGINIAKIERSYSIGLVNSDNGYGFIGYNCGGGCSTEVNDSFWNTQTSQKETDSAGSNATGKLTSEMKDIATFTNTSTTGLANAWDFTGTQNNDAGTDDIWKIDGMTNNGYPYLYWQIPAPVLTEVKAIPEKVTAGNAKYYFTTDKACILQVSAVETDKIGEITVHVSGEPTPGENSNFYLTGLQTGGTYSFNFQCLDENDNVSNTLNVGPFKVIASTVSSGYYSPGHLPSFIQQNQPVTVTQPTPPLINITRTLKLNMIGDDVKELQVYLNTHEYPVALNGLGSKGFETNKFGPLTKKAVIKFQLAHKLTPDGVVGPKTRGEMK